MKDLFSGNSDLIAVAAIALAVGLGSSINVETDIFRETHDRVMIRTRMAAFESELREAEREVRRAGQVLRNIACERR